MAKVQFIFILMILMLAACATPPPTPTLTPTPVLTPTITPTPRPEPVSASRALALTRADDPSQQAYVRVIHAAPDMPGIDAYIEGLTIANNLSFSSSTEPLGIVAGDYTLRIMVGGVRLDEGEPVFQAPLSPRGKESLILLITGTPQALVLTTFTESHEALPGMESRVTFINAVQDGPDFVVKQNETDLIPSLGFRQSSAAVTLPAGSTNLTFQSGDTVLTDFPFSLQGRTSYTLVLVGRPDDPAGLRLIQTQVSVPGTTSMRAINATEQSLDFYVGDILLGGNLGFGNASDRQQLPASVYAVEIYTANMNRDDAAPLATVQINPEVDKIISLIVIGTEDNLRVVSYEENLSPTPPNQTRVAFLNTLSSAPNVVIETQAGPINSIGSLAFGQPPQTAALEVSNYTFFWQAVENGQPGAIIENVENVQFVPGYSYLYLMTGKIAEPPLILSDKVGINQSLAGIEIGETPVAGADSSARARFVNAVSGNTALDFAIDGVVVASSLNYSDGSPVIDINAGDHSLEIRQSNTDITLSSLDISFDSASTYSLFAYGAADNVFMMAVPDTDIWNRSETSSTLRLINLTTGADTQLGLAFLPLTQSRQNTNRIATASQTDTFRQSMPMGVRKITGMNVINQEYSLPFPVLDGWNEIYVLDNVQSSVAATFEQVNLNADQHYDIIAVQRSDSFQVDAFALLYPTD